MLSDYKAIIFDWDGTLVDTCNLVLDAHNHVREYMGKPLWTMDDFMGRASKSAREYYPEIYGDRAEEGQRVLYEFVDEHHLKYLDPMAHATELLDFIKSQNLPIGIVSNKRHQTLLVEIETLGWAHYFDVAIGAGFAPKDKPSPEPLLMAINKINDAMKPSDILYVGDTETDLMTARNTGCPVVLIQSDKPRPDLVAKYKPDHAWMDVKSFLNHVTN